MKIDKKVDHAALARLTWQMAKQSKDSVFKQIFMKMADGAAAQDRLEKLTERLDGADWGDKGFVRRRHYRPDGSVEFIEMQDGRIIGRYRKRPKMRLVPDMSRPPRPNGKPQMKAVPRFDLLEALLLM